MARFSLFRSQTVKQASTLLAITALLSNGLGLGRNLLFYRFIPKGELDVYFASFRIADLLLNILIVGAITSAVIPTVSALIAQKKEQRAWEVTNQLLTWGTVLMTTIIALLAIFMPFIVSRILVPGFDDAQTAETTLLSRLMLIQALFFSWSFIIGALLNSYRRFVGYALAPLVYNIALIAGGILAGSHGVVVLIYAVAFGSFLHFLIQFIEAYRLGFRPAIKTHLDPDLKKIGTLMLPRSISQGVNQVVLLVYTNLSSGLPHGSLAIFNGMNDLQTTPTVIVANSLATASFPTLSAKVSEHKMDEVDELVGKLVRVCLFILIPTAILGLVLRAQVTRLYFGIGTADWGLTLVAITTFAWFMIGIAPSALVAVLSRVFYSTNDTRTPMVINIVTSIIGIALSWISIHRYGANVSVLALSETCIAASQALLYLAVLHRRRIVTLTIETLVGTRFSYVIGSVLVAASAWISLRIVDWGYSFTNIGGTNHVVGLLVQTLFASTVGLAVYFGYSNLQNKEELAWLRKRNFSKDR